LSLIKVLFAGKLGKMERSTKLILASHFQEVGKVCVNILNYRRLLYLSPLVVVKHILIL
jgi:hypothetical protein